MIGRLTRNQHDVVAVVYGCAILLSSLDTTIGNTSLASLGSAFTIPPTAVDMVVAGYLVSLSVFMPVAGWLGACCGVKRTFSVAPGHRYGDLTARLRGRRGSPATALAERRGRWWRTARSGRDGALSSGAVPDRLYA